jgi:Zn-dependent peptidase ImmA (M78 family)
VLAPLSDTAEAAMLILARESRGMTQAQLAEAARRISDQRCALNTVSQGYISKAEAGRITVTGERLALYAAALNYPPENLTMRESANGAGVGLVHHRRRASLAAADLRRINAVLNLTRIQLQRLLEVAGKPTTHRFEHADVSDIYTSEDVARQIRQAWGLPPGPLQSLITVIENAGGFVVRRQLAGRELDAVSQRMNGGSPLFLLNVSMPVDRECFTLAHEVGHVIMHRVPHEDQERQADQFASEFLMPARDILPSLKGGLDLSRLIELKRLWRVSMAAITRRAHTLGAISEWRYRQINIELSTLGYRTSEPAPIDPEEPAAAARLISDLRLQGLTRRDLARVAGLSEEEFNTLYLIDAH